MNANLKIYCPNAVSYQNECLILVKYFTPNYEEKNLTSYTVAIFMTLITSCQSHPGGIWLEELFICIRISLYVLSPYSRVATRV